jgi:5'-nucleotidase
MADILLTNDDGYTSIGFYPLLKELSKNYEVVAVAPDTQKSWLGKSISRKNQLVLKKEKLEEFEVYTVNGTPADCVQIGLYDVVKMKPKLVVSGINIGMNAGHGRILSSGTAGAGMEAVIDGIRAVISSLHFTDDNNESTNFFHRDYYHVYENPAKITAKVVSSIIGEQLEEDIDLLAINIPTDATLSTDFEITSLFREKYGKLFFRKGDVFVHENPPIVFENAPPGTDFHALANDKISITPISLELTSKSSKDKLHQIIERNW